MIGPDVRQHLVDQFALLRHPRRETALARHLGSSWLPRLVGTTTPSVDADLAENLRSCTRAPDPAFGRFTVTVDGRPVEHELPGRRGRLLVAVLADHRRSSVDRTILIERLWAPSAPGPGAAATFAAL